MSVQLTKDEKILRSYEYATSNSRGLGATQGSKTLVITNKRIIHKETISGRKCSGTNMSEMPISAAKYVNTAFRVTRYPILFVLGCLFVFLAAAMFVLFRFILSQFIRIPTILCLIPLLIAGICFLVYFLKKTYSFACSIDTDTRITSAFGFATVSGNSRTKDLFDMFRRANKNFYIDIEVNPEVTRQMAEEMGGIIAAAANGDFDLVDIPSETEEEQIGVGVTVTEGNSVVADIHSKTVDEQKDVDAPPAEGDVTVTEELFDPFADK